MQRSDTGMIRIGLIGDYDPQVKAHVAIPEASKMFITPLTCSVSETTHTFRLNARRLKASFIHWSGHLCKRRWSLNNTEIRDSFIYAMDWFMIE